MRGTKSSRAPAKTLASRASPIQPRPAVRDGMVPDPRASDRYTLRPDSGPQPRRRTVQMRADVIFTEQAKLLAAKARELADSHVRPGAQKYDKLQEYNWEAQRAV